MAKLQTGTHAVRIPGANLQLTQSQAEQLVRQLPKNATAEQTRALAVKLFGSK